MKNASVGGVKIPGDKQVTEPPNVLPLMRRVGFRWASDSNGGYLAFIACEFLSFPLQLLLMLLLLPP